ncbi:MAG: UGSC family (seleno)protein [Actinomycetes bacterium]
MFDSIVDPTVGSDVAPDRARAGLAPRPADLEGLSLGLLANTKRNAEQFLEDVASLMREQYGVKPVLARKKLSITHPVPAEMLDELAACDIVVTGVGDCGSCSASAVADGLLLEQSGVPSVVICTDAFTVSADAMAEVQGAPGYRYVTTDHPVASLNRDGIRARAEKVVPQIVALLTDAAAAARP